MKSARQITLELVEVGLKIRNGNVADDDDVLNFQAHSGEFQTTCL